MGKKEDRLNQIISFVQINKVVSYKDLSDSLGVSTMTIRRDLEQLASQNMLKLIRGGAIYYQTQDNAVPSYILQNQGELFIEEKTLIGIKACSLLELNDTFMIDSGSTAFCLAQAVPKDTNFTIICWSLNVIQELTAKPSCKLIVGGGVYHPEVQMFEGPEGVNLLRNSRASKLFLSAGGFHETLGITTPLSYETEMKRAAIESSLTKILIMDSSKFGRVCQSFLTDISSVDVIVTDSKISRYYQDFIRDKGIKLILA
ncbi:MAG: DeoR/GlpR family DNA-binding transcription regulator [Clostridia bacterium]|nr:DeoR/GlpR family DNA-binding transcription regulator [Clostridia bacterium]